MLRRPTPLIVPLIATTVVVTAVLCWLGWRLLAQQRSIDQQRTRERLESVADTLGARVAGRFAEAGDRLSSWVSDTGLRAPAMKDAVIVTVTDETVSITPQGALPFVPVVRDATGSNHDVFAEAEHAELTANRLPAAAEAYRALTRHRDPRVQAAAFMRLGAVLRKMGDHRLALDVYRNLAAMGQTTADQRPAELASFLGQRAAFRALRDRIEEQRVSAQLLEGLDRGRWALTRGVAELYRDEFANVPRPPSWQLAAALDEVWRERDGRLNGRGHRVTSAEPSALFVLWRSNGTRTALMTAYAGTFLEAIATERVGWRLSTPDGRLLAGNPPGADHTVVRVIASDDYPMTLNVWSLQPGEAGQKAQTILLLMMAAMLLFLWTATYFMARAIRREAGVSRLQSDFVAAVSHEFRSPLTTVRQMAEMLEMGRVPSDDRRQRYYQMLATETARLQQLVETLLNFGRMEAGAERYRFTIVPIASLVDGVSRQLQPQLADCGKEIETSGPLDAAVVADEAALSVALRNLIDNAIKYSPGQPTIRVRWEQESDRLSISVIDRGVGIPRHEHDAVFRKFVRGRAAIAASIRGTGVGLSMVRQIALAHGSDVRLQSEPGEGSTFTITLRAAPTGPAVAAASTVSPVERVS